MTNYKFLYHKDYTSQVLKALGNTADSEGFIVDVVTGERVLTKNTEEVNINEFAGIAKGSRIYLKSDVTSLIEYIQTRQ
ncbi:MAG: hypothetical protein UX37_C0017G0004 [Microgenomates group bacterium GW2011_GWA2_46_16]|nr:MAG: hypothetical protein UX37_C0017G0004 [Microgenomates group bacterium GW2011_GWA2_46_16]